MTIHLVKLCVGADTVADLEAWQDHVTAQRRAAGEPPLPYHVTRMTPKRADDVLLGGSLYWVVKGLIQVRQRVIALDAVRDAGDRPACRITLDPELILTALTPRKAFQGWRYLTPEDAPDDLSGVEGGADLPPTLRKTLIELGAW